MWPRFAPERSCSHRVHPSNRLLVFSPFREGEESPLLYASVDHRMFECELSVLFAGTLEKFSMQKVRTQVIEPRALNPTTATPVCRKIFCRTSITTY